MCSTETYTVGDTISGLSSSISLQINGGENLVSNTNGSFTFPSPLAMGSFYNVIITTQPVNQTCSVINGSGIIGNNNVDNIQVICSASTHNVGGVVLGLNGSVTLQNNGADNFVITNSGYFVFPAPIAEGSTYAVSILTQPTNQTCTVSNGSGTMSSGNVTSVQVT